MAMLETGLRRLFGRVVDGLDYVQTLVRLRILDAVAGPEPETSADQRREAGRERMQRAFPEIEP
jgi:hypothetical protein